MKMEILKKRIRKTIGANKDKLLMRIEIVAIITEALKVLKVRPIIVGGQAVEFYTSGGYATMDIDMLCGASIAEIDQVLKPLGFRKEGKYWTIENTDIAIEVPSGPLAGSWDKIAEVQIDKELSAYIIGIEDIIIDRLNRYKYWKEYSDKEWIIGMMIINYTEIDWDYVYEKSKQERTTEELIEFKKIVEENIKKLDSQE
jgi:hypothetical protein